MPDQDVQKVENLLEAARQRLTLALAPLSNGARDWYRRQEHTAAADELLARAQRMLKTSG
jgi:hypothetical protein